MAKVFIASTKEALPIAKQLELFLCEQKHDPRIWTQIFKPGYQWVESLKIQTNIVDFAIIIATPDDDVVSRSTAFSAPRDNIIFELGMFLGVLEKERVLVIVYEESNSKLPSDFLGIEPVRVHGDGLNDAFKVIMGHISEIGPRTRALSGKRLFQHANYYPINLEHQTRMPSFSKTIFMKAIKYFLESVRDPLAVTDLCYLWERNKEYMNIRMTKSEVDLYNKLVGSYDVGALIRRFDADHERIFRNYIQIVRDVGKTLSGVYFEILLHDVRNPLRSIVAAENTDGISGRKEGDPSTRFVVQYVKEQGRRLLEAREAGEKVSYIKRFNKDKYVKATTTFIDDETYGMVGIMCINIDIDAVAALTDKQKVCFFKNYMKHSGKTLKFEEDMFD